VNKSLQHLLMGLWVADREGETRDPDLHGHVRLTEGAQDLLLKTAAQEGYLLPRGGTWRLSERGEAEARALLRRHRLAERLLSDILELPEEEFEQSACRFEHYLSEHVTNRICTLLGHPTSCPHGRMIPPGECCRARSRSVEPIVERLSDLPAGEAARVVFLTPLANGNAARLGGLGLTPGAPLILLQKSPCCVVQVGETEIALDDDVAREIFVCREIDSA
jgi:DtxR family transcriptional regulator, Mn-dependent transcriptional regulator